MQEYKIILPTFDISRRVQLKAFELGYKWKSGDAVPLYLTENYEHYGIRMLYSGDIMCLCANNFNECEYPEISYQDFLAIGEPKQIINQNNMNKEITLKLAKTPKKAKNITVGEEYSGFYVDAEDSEVDSIEEAEYFRCINNNGKESRYSIDLFEPLTPIVPPLTYEQVINNLIVGEDATYCVMGNDETKIINIGIDRGLPDPSPVSCSCGIYSVDGLNDLYRVIELELQRASLPFEYNLQDFVGILFKKIVNAVIEDEDHAFCLFSTTEDQINVCELMDEICDNIPDSAKTGIVRNNNSGHNIKAWLIARP